MLADERAHEPLEPREALVVEVVRRLVEEEDVELGRQHGVERLPRCLAPGEGRAPVLLLRHIPNGQPARRAGHGAGVGLLHPGCDPQERRLADPVGADDADACPRGHAEGDVEEDRVGAVVLADAVEREHAVS